ncbi:hypothetical protein K469DRAFT_695255 [Zopfia rhizophila CBS 207.26]|uniref:Uncharacterized protein n=1 Tax=Zopfia rhizophila CBS 207.26 TaxID=1314779 RepID=A0A6A6DHX3_9PEZI|nr:hypothetical protein K469DRAFT_695255 [Zopfia rhizophila CBS 207.26]
MFKKYNSSLLELSIVAVHALNLINYADPEYKTWSKPPEKDGKLWLRDEFPKGHLNALMNPRANERSMIIKEAITYLGRYGLVFFGTSHLLDRGPTDELAWASLCSCCTDTAWIQSNHNMDALECKSLFDDLLKESFRHQLEDFKIVFFYEDFGNENQIRLDIDHANLCRFDLSVEADRDKYDLVEDIAALCANAFTETRTVALTREFVPFV